METTQIWTDNDDPILNENYQPSPQEQCSSEDEGDSSDDEDPIPEPTEHSRGHKCLWPSRYLFILCG